MTHGLDNSPAVLRRWGAAMQRLSGGDAPLPNNFQEWSKRNVSAAMELRDVDAELYQLLSGEAPSQLKLAAITGDWAAEAPSDEQRQSAARQQQIAELMAQGNPWGTPGKYVGNESDPGGMTYQEAVPGSLTNQLLIEGLDRDLAARLKAEASVSAPTPEQEFATRQAAAQATEANRLRSVQHVFQKGNY